MQKEQIILGTLVTYIVVLIALGYFGSRRTENNADLFIGGRTLGPFVAALSYFASSASAWVMLGLSGMSYEFGLSAIWMMPGLLLGHGFSWLWVAPRLQKLSHAHKFVTVTDLLSFDGKPETKRNIRFLSAGIVIFCFMFYIAASLQAAGGTFSITFDLPLTYSIIVGGVVIMCYTMQGGFWAVSLTDTLQGILMLIAAIALPSLALVAVGGFGGFWEGYKAVATAEQLSFAGGHAGIVLFGFLVGSLSIGVSVVGQPQMLTRFMSLKDSESVRPAQGMALSCFAISFTGMILLGLCGKIMVTELANREDIFFLMTDELMPVILGGIMVAAVLSAILSTADSQLLVSASSVAHDIMGEADEQHDRLLLSRFVIALLCGSAVVIAIYLPSDIFTRVLFAWNALGASFGPIVLMRLTKYSINPKAVLPAMVVGFTLTIVFFLIEDAPGDVLERIVPFLCSLAILVLTPRHKQ